MIEWIIIIIIGIIVFILFYFAEKSCDKLRKPFPDIDEWLERGCKK